MSGYGMFQSSALGMNAQTRAMQAISGNIANVNTDAYKRSDVHFATVLGSSLGRFTGDAGPSATGGVAGRLSTQVSLAGLARSTGDPLDATVMGRGFLILTTDLDGGETVYSRNGNLQLGTNGTAAATAADGSAITVARGYLVDGNGYYVQGWAPNADGTFPSSGATTALRIDPENFTSNGVATTQASLSLNLPMTDSTGGVRGYGFDIYDSAGASRPFSLHFQKTGTNTWGVDLVGNTGDVVSLSPSANLNLTTGAGQETEFVAAAGTIQVRNAGTGAGIQNFFAGLNPGDTVTTGSAINPGPFTVLSVSSDGSTVTVDTATPLAADETNAATLAFNAPGALGAPMSFDSRGQLVSGGTYAVDVTFADGTTATFSLDLANTTQMAGAFASYGFDRDGMGNGLLSSLELDRNGYVVGVFDNGTSKRLYRLALADFTNPDGLVARDGTVFVPSDDSGAPNVGAAGLGSLGFLSPGTVEMSNVDLANEFASMITVQKAYSSSAAAFRTVDEMTETARDLKH